MATKAYILGNGEVVTDEKYGTFATKSESKQLPPDIFGNCYGELNIVEPIYNPEAFALLVEENTYHYRACKTKARDTAGLGWELIPRKGIKAPRTGQKRKVEDFINNNGTPLAFQKESFTEVWNRAMFDYEVTGNGFIEIIRDDITQPIQGIAHIPSHTVRRHADGIRYVQIRGAKRRWFKEVGTADDIDMENGTFGAMNSVKKEKRGNEIIHIYNYTSRSDYYGVPDVLPAMRALLADRAAMEFNISFFDNHAVPAYAVTVTGTDLDEGVINHIKQYFQEDVKNSRHSTLVLTAQRDPNDVSNQPVEFKFEKLTNDVEEASFQVFRDANRDEILSAHGVPSYRAGITDIGAMGGNVASEATRIYKQSVVEPRQQMLEEIINKFILWDSYKAEDWEFKFVQIDSTDEAAELDMNKNLFNMGVLSPNEIRMKLGLEPIEDAAMDMHYVIGNRVTGLTSDQQVNPNIPVIGTEPLTNSVADVQQQEATQEQPEESKVEEEAQV